jgi:hypothetical protein
MSNNIYYLGAAGSLASLALGPGIWALVDAATHTRQVCASTSDNDVKSAQILDFAQFATCLLVFALPLYRLRAFHGAEGGREGREDKDAPPGTIAKVAYAFMFASFGLLVSIVIISGNVCGNNKCITTEAANDAQVQNGGTYRAQVVHMLGIDNPCAGQYFGPSYFKIAGNYCPENVKSSGNLCATKPTHLGGAEKCLVFACSNLVEGRQARFVISLVGLLLQIAAMYFIILFEQELTPPEEPDTAQEKAGDNPALSRQEKDASEDLMPRSDLRRRSVARYSSQAGRLEF